MTNPLALIIEDDENLANLFTQTLQLAEFETETIQDPLGAPELAWCPDPWGEGARQVSSGSVWLRRPKAKRGPPTLVSCPR